MKFRIFAGLGGALAVLTTRGLLNMKVIRKEAEAGGRLIVLPCKVGDTVWEIYNNGDACFDCIYYNAGGWGADSTCGKPGSEHDICPECADTPVCDKQHMDVKPYKLDSDWEIVRLIPRIGKTIFLTREAAKAALERSKPHGD